MTIENYGSVCSLDHPQPLRKSNVLRGKDLQKCNHSIDIRPMHHN